MSPITSHERQLVHHESARDAVRIAEMVVILTGLVAVIVLIAAMMAL